MRVFMLIDLPPHFRSIPYCSPRHTVNTLGKLTIFKFVVLSNLSARLARFLRYVVQGGEYTGA